MQIIFIVPQTNGLYDAQILTERLSSFGLPAITPAFGFYMWSGKEDANSKASALRLYIDGANMFVGSARVANYWTFCIGD